MELQKATGLGLVVLTMLVASTAAQDCALVSGCPAQLLIPSSLQMNAALALAFQSNRSEFYPMMVDSSTHDEDGR
jgi:hypothetical protein